MRVRFTKKTDFYIACVASVSMRFRSKGRGTRICKDRAKNCVTFIFWLFFHFSRGQNRESRSSVFLCSETKRNETETKRNETKRNETKPKRNETKRNETETLATQANFYKKFDFSKKGLTKLNGHALLMW